VAKLPVARHASGVPGGGNTVGGLVPATEPQMLTFVPKQYLFVLDVFILQSTEIPITPYNDRGIYEGKSSIEVFVIAEITFN
jgi:hypothetical protein